MTSRSAAYLFLKWRAIVLLLLNRQAAAHAVFGEMIRRWPADPYARSSRAHVGAQLGQVDLAIDDLRVVTDADPDGRPADWFNLAFLLDQQDDRSGAEAAFRRAVSLDPKLDRAWYGLGVLLLKEQRLDEALAAFKRNTELQPMSPHGWVQLARVHLDRRQPEEARKIVRHLKGFEPKVAAQLEREVG